MTPEAMHQEAATAQHLEAPEQAGGRRAGAPDEVRRSTHQVTTRDRARVVFDLYRRPGRNAVLIVCPGFFQSKSTPTFRRLAAALAHERDVICLDFRGHGDSSGLYTFSAREDADLEAVLEWAHPRYSEVVLLGFSLGAATAINVASRQRHIHGLIAVSTPTVFNQIEFRFWTPEAIRTGLHGLEPRTGCRPGNLWLTKPRPLERIRSLAPKPVLLIHGTRDRVILPHHSEQLYAQAAEPKRLLLIEGGGHAEELYRQAPARFLAVVHDWLQEMDRSGR